MDHGATAARIGELGEFGLIERLTTAAGPLDPESVPIGPGDDAASVRLPGQEVLVSTDTLVEGVHFRTNWAEARQIGRRAAAASLADIAAMGGANLALVVAFTAPRETSTIWADELNAGLLEEAAKEGAALVGGDVSVGPVVSLTVTALGSAKQAVRRNGAGPDQVVAVSGRLGWAAAGLTLLSRGFRSPRVLVDAYRSPQPPYESGRRAAAAGATAMIDISDGLLADAGHIAAASGVAIDIDPNALPVAEELGQAASAFHADAMRWVLTGGDDHAILATFASLDEVPSEFVVIGLTAAASDTKPNVLVGGKPWDGPVGHDHFRLR